MYQITIRKPLLFRVSGLLLAALALSTVPAAAQQEVAPDHFEAAQSAAKNPKPTPAHKAVASKGRQARRRPSSLNSRDKNKAQVSAALSTGPARSSR